jgi:hypothetical protein
MKVKTSRLAWMMIVGISVGQFLIADTNPYGMFGSSSSAATSPATPSTPSNLGQNLVQPGAAVGHFPTATSAQPLNLQYNNTAPNTTAPLPTYTPGLLPNQAQSSAGASGAPVNNNPAAGDGGSILRQIDADLQSGFNLPTSSGSSTLLSISGYQVLQSSGAFSAPVQTPQSLNDILQDPEGFASSQLGGLYLGGASSQNNLLIQAVSAPFAATWQANLSVASSPQLLQLIAEQQAIQNYIAYQQLNRLAEQELVVVANLKQMNTFLQDIDSNSVKNLKIQQQILLALKALHKNN